MNSPEPTHDERKTSRFRRLRLVVSVLVTVALGVLLTLAAVEEYRNSQRMVGVGVRVVDDGIEITRVMEDRPAARAGLRAGDRLLAVDGDPVADFTEYDRHAIDFHKVDVTTFTIERDGQKLDLQVVPGAPFRWFRFGMSRIGPVLYLILGLIAFGSAATDVRARLLTLFSFAVAFELSVPEIAFGEPAWTALAGLFYLVVSGFQMGVFLHLASVIPEPQPWIRRNPWVVPVYHIVGVGFGVCAGLVFVSETFGVEALPVSSADLTWVFSAVLLPVWAVAVAVILAREALRNPEPQGRQQAGLVLVGVVPWTAYIVLTTLLPSVPVWFSWYSDTIQSAILLCYPVAVFFAIFRYQLFDIEVVVRRGLVYTSLTVILVALAWILLSAGGTLAAMVTSETTVVFVVSATTLLIGLLFSPLRDLVRATVDRRFFPERYALRNQLIALAEELPTLRQLPRMGSHLAERLREIFAVNSVTLLLGDPETGVLTTLASTLEGESDQIRQSLLLALDDPGVEHLKAAGKPTPAGSLFARSASLEQRLRQLEVTLAVPVSRQESLIGVVLLGQRRQSNRYPAEELELLSLLSHHVATTFENARLFESATYEGLTGLLRRESILDQLDAEVARALRYQRPLTVGMADLDHFKQVNDNHGHLVGDEMLQRVASTISKGLRGTDIVGRYGGEEFLLVLPETGAAEAATVADKIRELVQQVTITADDGREVRVTVSIGLASLENLDGAEAIESTDLIAVADSHLYAAKRAGRNRVMASAEA